MDVPRSSMVVRCGNSISLVVTEETNDDDSVFLN